MPKETQTTPNFFYLLQSASKAIEKEGNNNKALIPLQRILLIPCSNQSDILYIKYMAATMLLELYHQDDISITNVSLPSMVAPYTYRKSL